MRVVLALLALWAGVTLVLGVAQAQTLRFQMEGSIREPGAPAPHTQRVWDVQLRPGQIAIKDTTKDDIIVRIYNFPAERRAVYSTVSQTVQDVPLSALVTARVLGRQNSDNMADMVKATKPAALAEAGLQQYNLDALYSLSVPGKPLSPVTFRTYGPERVAEHEGVEVARFTPGPSPVPDVLKDEFEKFLLYEFSLHPTVRKEIVASRVLPARVQFQVRPNSQVDEHTYEFVVRDYGQAPLVAPVGYVARPTDDDSLNSLLRRVRPARDDDRRFMNEKVRKLLDDGNHITALLVAYESVWTFGDQADLMPVLQAIQALPADSAAAVFLQRLVGRDDQPPAERAQEIFALMPLSQGNSAVLKIMVADELGKAEKPREAMVLSKDVLQQNTQLTEAWDNLAGLILRTPSRAVEAFACWEAAERIAPRHPMFKGQHAYVEALKKDFPEFFK